MGSNRESTRREAQFNDTVGRLAETAGRLHRSVTEALAEGEKREARAEKRALEAEAREKRAEKRGIDAEAREKEADRREGRGEKREKRMFFLTVVAVLLAGASVVVPLVRDEPAPRVTVTSATFTVVQPVTTPSPAGEAPKRRDHQSNRGRRRR